MRRHKRSLLRLLCLVAAIGALAAVFLFVFDDRTVVNESDDTMIDIAQLAGNANVLYLNDRIYRPEGSLTLVLLEGIDDTLAARTSSSYRNNGQADFLTLLIVDNARKQISYLPIDRDSMWNIEVLDVLGKPAGERLMQLSLSHAFGDGQKGSAERTKKAVEAMLLDLPIQYYISLKVEHLATINDHFGGVTVTLGEDFSLYDETMTAGTTVHLEGKQAEIYLRSRSGMEVATNVARMKRQQNYLSLAFAQMRERIKADRNYVSDALEQVYDLLYTNMTKEQMASIALRCIQFEEKEVLSIPGEHRISDDGFTEFYADEQAIQDLVVTTFYHESAW